MNMRLTLRRGGLLVAAGLLIGLLSLLPVHPLAFMAFVCISVPVTVAGTIYFLLGLICDSEPSGDDPAKRLVIPKGSRSDVEA
jgi:hypothetical protein